ncbi:MAG: putative hydroxymethylpyrimidine transporter CytX [Deltaproteobacteria bacterium]|jgi:putative hydroxymethylpyrimidine transporter CytX|nr:putative hydroxymethylpyrimidine transporter CytX [Deltaproteobacteria bacterium]MBW2486124.1 putative hydroxymethylpyrimidine transporter CytX [Deltaproteobacteria bacterium]MBW2517704.1 putative hydroxymethylpyrimidine transporter CytX [Deltaproteobacteria bacterium]
MNIQPISLQDRNLSGLDYFLLWAGVAISLAEIWAGGFLAPMGLWLGFLAILLGHFIGNTFMALGGMIGSQHGLMSMVSVRPSFGIRGSNLAAVLNIIQLIGWASIMLIIGGRAGAMLGKPMGGILASNHFWIITIGLGTLIWAQLTGKPIWRLLQKLAVAGLLVVIVLMSGVSIREFGSDVFKINSGDMPFMIGLDLVIAMPISWMPLAADYARFSRRTAPAFWNTWLGYFLISSWMYALGLAATLVTGTSDPGSLILQVMGKIGLAVPALAMVVFSTITTGFPDVYSAACSTMNISQRFSSRTIVWAAGIISIGVALVFPMEQYENFLFLIGAMFVPLFGVVLTDYFLIRGRQLSIEDVFRPQGSYWYTHGFNVVALLCWAIGFLVYQLITLLKYPLGGSMPSLLVAGLCYYVITRLQQKRAS